MRGLTLAERRFMLGDAVDDEMACSLERRGLLVEGRCECGGPVDIECGCKHIEMAITPTGYLALRLDAAARAIGGTP